MSFDECPMSVGDSGSDPDYFPVRSTSHIHGERLCTVAVVDAKGCFCQCFATRVEARPPTTLQAFSPQMERNAAGKSDEKETNQHQQTMEKVLSHLERPDVKGLCPTATIGSSVDSIFYCFSSICKGSATRMEEATLHLKLFSEKQSILRRLARLLTDPGPPSYVIVEMRLHIFHSMLNNPSLMLLIFSLL